MMMARPPGFSTRWTPLSASWGVGRMVQNPMRKDPIEALIREAEMLGVFLVEHAAQPHDFEMFAGGLQGRFRQIDAGVVRAIECKHHSLNPVAGPDFQYSFASGFGERDQQRNVPFCAIAVVSFCSK